MDSNRKSDIVLDREEVVEEKVTAALQSLERQIDLEGSAQYCGALRRRRNVKSALDLLRLVMVYCLTDYSLRMVGAWGTVMGWGSLCKSAVRKRLIQCQPWIGYLVALLLLAGNLKIPQRANARLRLFDTSNFSEPGSRKIDWRLHLSFDLWNARIDDVKLTSVKEGETLTRWQFRPDEICLADRCYGVPRSLGVILGAMAFFVIRISWHNLPLEHRDGSRFSVSDWLKVQSGDPCATPAQAKVWVATPPGRFAIRLLARAIPPEKAKKIRQNLLAEAKRRNRRVDERSLLAAGFVMVVSNLPEDLWSANDILALYRFRWQIELVFKRLKGILNFDALRATEPAMVQVYLLSKILVALLLQEFQWRLALANSDNTPDDEHPVSLWRFTQLVFEAFRQALCGNLTFELIEEHHHELLRYLCDDPRRRRQQFATRSKFQGRA